MKKHAKLGIIIVIFLLSTITPALSKKDDRYVAKIPYKFNAKPSWAAKPSKDTTSVEILNIPQGETVTQSVIVIVEAKGATKVTLGEESMTPVGHGDRYYGTWTTTLIGPIVIAVEASDSEGNVIASDSVSVNVLDEPKWSVYLEIDYLAGHEPSPTVLDYLQSYWRGFAINVVYLEGDMVTDPTDNGIISDSDFWELEYEYNGAYEFNDKANDDYDADGQGYDAEYMSPEKWILWGSWDSNINVGGYTYVVIDNKDALAGNYIFIADGMIDKWETQNQMNNDNGEVIVACHELGHSIGILQLKGQSEKYDPDYYSIMSTMRAENALYMQDAWYYSSTYWNSKNLEYYE